MYDLVIIGGGINGAGIARDAAGRGLKVALIERDDLAQHTSSASTKLVHGGLRYLEHYQFNLVRKALIEREVIMRIAPHITWPLRFVVPHVPSMRPAWMMRAGLFLYDHLAKRELLPGSEHIRFDRHPSGGPLREGFKRGFVYSDGWVDDARLVLLNALDAHERGASVMTRTTCVGARRVDSHWELDLRPTGNSTSHTGDSALTIKSKALVNATGPWVAKWLEGAAGQQDVKKLRLVKGSHIVIPKLYDHDFVYLLQNHDQRVIFAIPYEEHFTLVGTTDIEISDAPGQARIDASEIQYLCDAVNHFFKRDINAQSVVHTYCGVRPLVDDESGNASEVTRDYFLELDNEAAPLLSVYGGKITTYRKLAEEAMLKLAPLIGVSKHSWTGTSPLPGGNIRYEDFGAFVGEFQRLHDWLTESQARRLVRAYGTKLHEWFPMSEAEAGRPIAPGLYEAELEYVWQREWAQSGADFLWRRSKLGLHLTPEQSTTITQWFTQKLQHTETSNFYES